MSERKRRERTRERLRKHALHYVRVYMGRTTPIFDAESAKRLRNIRSTMKLSQAQLGSLLRVSQSTVSRMENATNDDTPPTLAKFKTALGGHFDYFIWGVMKWQYERPTNDDESSFVNLRKQRKITRND